MFIIYLSISVILVLSAIIVYFYRRDVDLRKKYDRLIDYFSEVNAVMNYVRYGNLSVRVDETSKDGMSKLTESINRMIETLYDRETMVAEYRTELMKKNNFLGAIFDSLSDGLLVCDDEFIIIDANKKIKTWFDKDDIVGTMLKDYIKPAEEKSFDKLSDDEVFLVNNQDLFFKASTTVINSKEHRDKYLIVVTDYTAQKEIESLKEDFVATLTHDLKVPVIAEANMLEFFISGKFGELTETQREALNTMCASNKELLELVQTVLDTYKVKEGEIELKPEKVKVKHLLEETAEEMMPIAQKNNNNIVIDVEEDYEVNIDYLQFKRIIKNLINNAVIYGKPKTDVEVRAFEKEDYYYICVKDYGKGIAKEDIDKVFNKYYSAHKKFRKIGTGLGLYLSQKLVKAHNGTLEVTSKEGEWSEFVIKLSKKEG